MPKVNSLSLSVVVIEDRASNFIRTITDLVPKGRHVQMPPLPAVMLQTVCSVGGEGELVTTILPSREALAWAAKVGRDCFPEAVSQYALQAG